MSMRNYAVYGYGIVLNGKVDQDILEELSDDEDVVSQYSFTGEAFPLKADGSEDWNNGEAFNDDTLYVVELPKSPMLFKAAYKNMDALVDDMLKTYSAIDRLPKLTRSEIRERIRSYIGSYYG